MTAVVVGIAAIGIAFMYSFGNTWVVAKGDDRVALSLAQQKIERLRALGYADAALNPGVTGSELNMTASGSASDRKFNRYTCVENVSDTAVSTPAYAGGNTGSPCNANAATNTKRITVVVQPWQSGNQRYADPPVILQAWITVIPGGI